VTKASGWIYFYVIRDLGKVVILLCVAIRANKKIELLLNERKNMMV
jgi:hypothetical protein